MIQGVGGQVENTPLYQYVHTDDGQWSWAQVAEYPGTGMTTFVLSMTSQVWQTGEWFH